MVIKNHDKSLHFDIPRIPITFMSESFLAPLECMNMVTGDGDHAGDAVQW